MPACERALVPAACAKRHDTFATAVARLDCRINNFAVIFRPAQQYQQLE
jgi:hypothetical protein